MYSHFALVLALALGRLIVPAPTFAQLTPPAGSAGAGNSAINGVPFGPANPRILVDPSGIGNASRIPPLGRNPPTPPTSYGSINSSPLPPARVIAPPYAGAPQRTIDAYSVERKRHAPVRRRVRSQVSTFTGICRGC
jgi:hypothetical protein